MRIHKVILVATLYCMALASLLVGGIATYERIDHSLHSRRATMELADPGREITLRASIYDEHLLDVRYASPEGDLLIPRKRLDGDVARKLVSGAKVPITYLTNNPQHVDFAPEEGPNAWGWLALGAALLAIARYARKLLHRELQ